MKHRNANDKTAQLFFECNSLTLFRFLNWKPQLFTNNLHDLFRINLFLASPDWCETHLLFGQTLLFKQLTKIFSNTNVYHLTFIYHTSDYLFSPNTKN